MSLHACQHLMSACELALHLGLSCNKVWRASCFTLQQVQGMAPQLLLLPPVTSLACSSKVSGMAITCSQVHCYKPAYQTLLTCAFRGATAADQLQVPCGVSHSFKCRVLVCNVQGSVRCCTNKVQRQVHSSTADRQEAEEAGQQREL